MVAQVIGKRSYANAVKDTEDKLNSNGPEFNLIGTDKGIPLGSLPRGEIFSVIEKVVKNDKLGQYASIYSSNKGTRISQAPIKRKGKKPIKKEM